VEHALTFFESRRLAWQGGLPTKQLDNRPVHLDAEAVLAFSCIRDESLRLPWFLEFYRQAGVTRFFIVDNGSQDGSTEYLTAQTDVSLFFTEDSYAESECGLKWINGLLDRFADGHWALTLDADELLVYPVCERVDIRQLAAYLESVGADSLMTMILDMYSDRAIASTRYTPGEPFLEACPFFDSDTYSRDTSHSVPVRGGARERVFWRDFDREYPAPFLPKVPLVKWRRGRFYEASTHRISNIRPAELTGALLHFKFFDDFPGRAALEAERKEHFAEARQYVTYSEVLTRTPELTMFHERSVRYVDSLQLVRLGMLRMPDSYRALVASQNGLGDGAV
jgi:hypothetical protein